MVLGSGTSATVALTGGLNAWDRFQAEVEICALEGCLTKPHGVISPALGADEVHLCFSQRAAYSRHRLDIVSCCH